jgi:hypothetical protein
MFGGNIILVLACIAEKRRSWRSLKRISREYLAVRKDDPYARRCYVVYKWKLHAIRWDSDLKTEYRPTHGKPFSRPAVLTWHFKFRNSTVATICYAKMASDYREGTQEKLDTFDMNVGVPGALYGLDTHFPVKVSRH